jgi:hypothetical protein
MKATDDYQAKIRFWASNPRVEPLPPVARPLPRFRAQRFSSHLEMNRWKQALLIEVARSHAADG